MLSCILFFAAFLSVTNTITVRRSTTSFPSQLPPQYVKLDQQQQQQQQRVGKSMLVISRRDPIVVNISTLVSISSTEDAVHMYLGNRESYDCQSLIGLVFDGNSKASNAIVNAIILDNFQQRNSTGLIYWYLFCYIHSCVYVDILYVRNPQGCLFCRRPKSLSIGNSSEHYNYYI